mgnify:FL=1
MPSLKDLRNRIDSVKSTRKITLAMKMVAASKLKKAQGLAEKGRDYSRGLDDIAKGLVASLDNKDNIFLGSDSKNDKTLVLVISSDRGLCGGLNSSLIKKAKLLLNDLEKSNKKITLMCIGKKGYDLLYSFNKKYFNSDTKFVLISDMDYQSTEELGLNILANFYDRKFEECYIFYNFFKSVISQEVVKKKLIPYEENSYEVEKQDTVFYEYEPDEETVLSKILPKNFIVQMYKAILESRASEQGARMTAMDNASRNAGEMIDNLSLSYNRQRQAMITKELIEIISGAEAL